MSPPKELHFVPPSAPFQTTIPMMPNLVSTLTAKASRQTPATTMIKARIPNPASCDMAKAIAVTPSPPHRLRLRNRR
jgi:hypothetical protein